MQRLPCGPELLAPWERVAHAGTPSHSEDPKADQFPEVPHSHPAIQDEAAPEVPRLRVVVLGASRGSGVPGDPRLGLDVVTRR